MLSEEHKQKIRIAALKRTYKSGWKHSESTKRKIGIANSNKKGKNSSNWKGGISTENNIQRQYFSKYIVPKVLVRDNYTCSICEIVGGYLHVDHIKKWSDYPDLRFDLNNCRLLCRPCHYQVTFGKVMSLNSKWGYKTNIKTYKSC